MTTDGLYHKDIRLPENFIAPTQRVTLAWTLHAERARQNDRYGVIPKFNTIPLAAFEVIEVEVINDRVSKLVVRGHYNADLDIVFVVIPNGTYVVKTVWFQERNDLHRTLDRSRYVS